jgi:cell division protein FtsW
MFWMSISITEMNKTGKFWNFYNNQARQFDWYLLSVVIALCLFGLAFLASTLSAEGTDIFQREFFKQLIFGVWIGGVLTFVFSRIDYHILFKLKNLLLLATFASLSYIAIFILIAGFTEVKVTQVINAVSFLPLVPYSAGGAVRWIETPITNFQPSEFAKFAILVYFAAYLNEMKDETITLLSLKKPMYAFLLIAFLILIQPDLGSTILMFLIVASGMWVAKVPLKLLVPISIVVVIAATFLAFTSDYRVERIQAIYNPSREYAYQINQARTAIRNGGMWGLGFGNSEFKQNNLIPEASTDGILGVIGEEIGFIFTTLFLSLYLLLLWRGIKIAENAKDVGGKVLATGISVWIVSQAFFNVTGITGITPLKGIPLPFVSKGGSSLVVNLATIGVLLNVSYQGQKDTVNAFQTQRNTYKINPNIRRSKLKT